VKSSAPRGRASGTSTRSTIVAGRGEPELAARIGAVLDTDDSPVVLYCGGGISAAGAALALTLLGRTDVSVYDGSLEEWSKDPARPLELGS